VWWERYRYDPRSEKNEWAEQWVRLEGVVTTSGLTIAGVSSGHFHLFGRDAAGELRHSEYRGDTWVRRWEPKGLITVGSPSVWLGNATWINVFARGSGNSLGIWGAIDNITAAWNYSEGTTFSDAAAVGWLPMRWDVFFINQNGVIERTWGDLAAAATVDTGLNPPGESINAVSRERGSIDIIADGWHAIWPRDPIAGELAASRSDR
jgi:hypothetical protein